MAGMPEGTVATITTRVSHSKELFLAHPSASNDMLIGQRNPIRNLEYILEEAD